MSESESPLQIREGGSLMFWGRKDFQKQLGFLTLLASFAFDVLLYSASPSADLNAAVLATQRILFTPVFTVLQSF
ncbi:hypothetical protein UY3_00003 [Chelonia mydas]|uniref:Uncharacterized protein n=1 Tax=Chelonia mydas TaxID=8469 RepID=M7CN80_CHEMY|nr:hypothetical protein UY3_00003 [Chelonia mydas]